jgi:epoxyqueuosine reductase QueG
MVDMKEDIRRIVLALGADVCGFASGGRLDEYPAEFSPRAIYKECKTVVAFGVALPKGLFEVNPRLIYSHFNGDIVCRQVDDIAFRASRKIEEKFNALAIPLPCDSPNEYWDAVKLTAKGLISMKHTGVLCGLGQLGKNTLLLNEQYGNRLTIGAILLNVELEADPLSDNICIEGCHKCVKSCPVQAIDKESVHQNLCRPHTYGKTARGFATVDCNICRRICPMKNGRIVGKY